MAIEDEDIESLLEDLDGIARGVDVYEYGLPYGDSETRERLRAAVRSWFDQHAASLTRERDEWRSAAEERGRKLAAAGVEGSPPPGRDTTIGTMRTRIGDLARERDAWKQAAVRVYREGWECESDVDALAVLRGRFGIVSE